MTTTERKIAWDAKVILDLFDQAIAAASQEVVDA